MKNQQELIIILSVCYTITLFLCGVIFYFYNSEIEVLNKVLNNLIKLFLIKSKKINILLNQNKKYSTICRRLYDENQNLKSYNKQLIEIWDNNIREKYDLNVEIEELKLKNQGLESKKLKKRVRKEL